MSNPIPGAREVPAAAPTDNRKAVVRYDRLGQVRLRLLVHLEGLAGFDRPPDLQWRLDDDTVSDELPINQSSPMSVEDRLDPM
jgi:hypothetical protein